jgi:hypothetical protein
MSADLIHSARLVRDQAFQDLVAAAMVEHALSLTTDPLSKAMVLDPSNLLPIFLRIVADNPAISDPAWDGADSDQKQSDVRYAIGASWDALKAAIPNLPAAG